MKKQEVEEKLRRKREREEKRYALQKEKERRRIEREQKLFLRKSLKVYVALYAPYYFCHNYSILLLQVKKWFSQHLHLCILHKEQKVYMYIHMYMYTELCIFLEISSRLES